MKVVHIHFDNMGMGFVFRAEASAELVFESICSALREKHDDVVFSDDTGDYQFKAAKIVGVSLLTVGEDMAVTRPQSSDNVLSKLKSALGGGRIS